MKEKATAILYTANLKLRRRGVGEHFTGKGRTGEPKVVLLPRPGLFSRIGWGHVELHVLHLPITQAAHLVADLSPGDLPMSSEDTPQCWVVNEGMSLTRPRPGIKGIGSGGRNGGPKMPIYSHRQWQQSRWIRADKDQWPGIIKGANGGCSKSPKINDQDHQHL